MLSFRKNINHVLASLNALNHNDSDNAVSSVINSMLSYDKIALFLTTIQSLPKRMVEFSTLIKDKLIHINQPFFFIMHSRNTRISQDI
jgi:hypothetical protein